MSIVQCADCSKKIDLDVEDCSSSDDNSYLCEECSDKPNDELTTEQEDLILDGDKKWIH